MTVWSVVNLFISMESTEHCTNIWSRTSEILYIFIVTPIMTFDYLDTGIYNDMFL